MKKKIIIPIISVVLVLAIALPIVFSLGGKKKKDSIVIMSEEFSGLFNPFYATSGTDMDVVGMTQLGMLSTKYNDETKSADLVAGNEYPCAVLDYGIDATQTQYTFVLKNGLKFADGTPLTMNDVMFNIYEYLDPVYTGSSTMYSIKIKGLEKYRTQSDTSAGGAESLIESNANAKAKARMSEITDVWEDVAIEITGGKETLVGASREQILQAIESWNVSAGYKDAVSSEKDNLSTNQLREKLKEDYEYVLTSFMKELEDDYKAAQESFDLEAAPYKDHTDKFSDEIFKFLYFEGIITPEYKDNNGVPDKSVIVKFENENARQQCSNKQDAINLVYKMYVEDKFTDILSSRSTWGTVLTQFSADAKSIILRGKDTKIKNVEGIVSVGHTKGYENVDKVSFKSEVSKENKEYTVAHSHKEDGTPAVDGQYDVLQITLDSVDPKALLSFSFSVAPAHYYTAAKAGDTPAVIDIANDKFGVEFADSNFQTKIIQSIKNVSVPMGAGIYEATDANNNSNPDGNAFYNSNICYFKANKNFIFEVKHEKMRMQVVSSSGAVSVLERGDVDYVTPQLTTKNYKKLQELQAKGLITINTPLQLGYGYIGINAGKVPNVNVRKAIMSAMKVQIASDYYEEGTCLPIDWPMSTTSWAYPFAQDGSTIPNGKDYMTWEDVDQATSKAEAKIRKYTLAAVQDGITSSDLKISFTIAGSSITEHPTYGVFKKAVELLNAMEPIEGVKWDVSVKADSQALTKLSTGSLSVWAAAWGSAIDPDMYQVYHINSTATSTYAWGYREIKSNTTGYPTEYNIIKNKLSPLIDDARATLDQSVRKELYKEAMGYVLDLAVEMPVYQRSTLYAYNTKNVKGFYEDVNSYNSPLNEMWKLELVG